MEANVVFITLRYTEPGRRSVSGLPHGGHRWKLQLFKRTEEELLQHSVCVCVGVCAVPPEHASSLPLLR